jgi:hypothetical protein
MDRNKIIMNVLKHIFWFLSIQFITFSLLFYVFKIACEVYPVKTTDFQTHIHWNLYIDKNIDPSHVMIIKIAADRWTKATNHIAEFNVEVLSAENRNFARHDPQALIVTVITEDNSDIIRMDEDNRESTVAYCNVRASIPTLAYVDGRVDDKDFEKITMHELGHALKLEHTNGPFGAGHIMYHTTNLMSEGITKEDLEQFCKVYHCDASKLEYEEESLHL